MKAKHTSAWAINYQKQMDDFFAEMRGNNERNFSDPTGDLWSDAHMRFHFPDKDEARFAQDLERIREANKSVPKRFDWLALIALLGVAGFVMWFIWYGMGQF